MNGSAIRFVHISDTHFGPAKDFELYGVNPFEAGQEIVRAINGLPTQPSFVIHTGDVAAHPDPSAYAIAAEVFGELKAPIYYVVGNHDTARAIHASLPMGRKTDFSSDRDTLAYSFTIDDVRFIALDARGPDEIDPSGILAGHQIDFLEREIHKEDRRVVIFVHFPPLALDSLWYDESMLLLNGELLHKTLLPVRGRVDGVFFGHVHRGMQVTRDGILYSAVGGSVGQFLAHPELTRAAFDLHHPPCFNFIALKGSTTIVKEYSLHLGRT